MDIFNKQEREGRSKYISLIVEGMNDDDIAILAHVYKKCRQGKIVGKGASIDFLIEKSGKSGYCVRHSISRLEVARFVQKASEGRTRIFAITDEGVDALNHLLSDNLFPRAKQEIGRIIDERH